MGNIAARQPVVTGIASDGEPSDAELSAIEREMPVVLAEVELLDAQIMTLDRIPSEVDARRLRRARRRVLAARRDLANCPAGRTGGAA
ncbi:MULTISPECIES: DUF6284 family protein [unclassified Streptomyces]|uniref:DUF6284 family protein n=1 Tax=unclassified Streptomyces TaxID=2593676 RepID=UPI00037BD292|nr:MULTISPECIES: DUF6284 family protein [unclassified Streptomyces]MYX36436.1 hypothetical protein [Streptomyces sp. SID8377]